MDNFIVGLLLFLVEIFVISIIGGLIYLIYLPIKKKLLKSGKLTLSLSQKINRIYISSFFICFLILFSFSYIGVFPRDSFYIEEFKYNTGLELPDSAEIITKDASYPDFFGDFWAAAIIELSTEDYEKLKNNISHLKNFKIDTTSQKIGITEAYNVLTKEIKESDLDIVFFNNKQHWFKVAFLKDKRTIIFERSSS
ncbi:MAG: hypothetical protein K1X81_01275 [Bacteroidia bacterium]|nr:hypothetical protein [Bacteroidia bacterium]